MYEDIESRINSSQVIEEPFPHIIIDNFFESELANNLVKTYPLKETNLGSDNERWNISSDEVLKGVGTDLVWRKVFSEIHVTSFVNILIDKFRPHVNQEYIKEFDHLLRLNRENLIDLGRKNIEDNNYFEIQVSGNTKVIKKRTVRGVHVDSGKKIFTGLLYLDNKDFKFYKGGNLHLF